MQQIKPKPENIQKTYLTLVLSNTLATSFIWGINTLFLLDAGLTNIEAFLANAFFTLGQVIFEVPTGIIADGWGRRTSYLLGSLTLAISTLIYFFAWQLHAPFILWAITSILLGLGFTFFSGATEAWLVDALKFTGFKGTLESVFAKGQMIGGIAMLVGSISGGLIAQFTNLGIPYILRSAVLGINFIIAFFLMRDLGFTPERTKNIIGSVRKIFTASLDHSFRNPPVRWIMLTAPFTVGVGFYTFYAMQPYLLQLYGNPQAYGIAGLAAAIIAGAQIGGGFIVPYLKNLFKHRTSVLIASMVIACLLLIAIGVTTSFVIAIALIIIWALVSAAGEPVRRAYLNGLIPSKQRATVLSFDSLVGSSGAVFIQPALGKVADVWSYSISFIGAAVFQLMALPFLILAKKENARADPISKN